MDLVTLATAKAYTNKVAAGFSSVSVEGSTIHFTLNDGQKIDMTIPTPENGVSVNSVTIDDKGHLICTLSNGEAIDAGVIPTDPGQPASKQYVDNSVATFTLDGTTLYITKE